MDSHFFFGVVVQQEGAEEDNWHKDTSSCGRDDGPRTLLPKHSVVPIWGKYFYTLHSSLVFPSCFLLPQKKKKSSCKNIRHLKFFLS